MAVAALTAGSAPAGAATYPTGFEERSVASGLTAPVATAWVPDGRMFIAEKRGRVKVVMPNGVLSPTPVLDISSHVYAIADRGMLGMAADSDFANNHYLYLLYVYQPAGATGNGARTSRLTRVTVNDNNTASAEVTILGSVGTPPCPAPSNTVDCIPADSDSHSIGTVRSDADGTLWLGSGDGSDWSRVDPRALRTYDEQSFAGKIMHIDRNGNGLPGHAFCPAETDLTKVCTKLYAKGLRNPYRFQLRSGTGPVIGDVGWEEWEEIDLVTAAGKNFGWPCYEGNNRTSGYRDLAGCTAQYANEGTPLAATPPNFQYAHSLFPDFQAAVVAGPVYPAGGPYPSEYAGDIFYGDYAHGYIKRLKVNAAGQVTSNPGFATAGPAWVDVSLGPNGNIYFADYGDGNTGTGSIKQIVYTPTNGSPVARATANPTSGAVPLNVQFTGSGSTDPNNDPLTYEWDFGDGTAHSTAVNPTHAYTTSGTFTAVLTVRDGRGGVSTANVVINAANDAPVVSINAPANDSIYRIGSAIQLDGSATDAQEGELPGSALSWHVSLVHITHLHDLDDFTGKTPSFDAATDHDADAHYRITLTAQDSVGASSQKTIDIFPEAVNLTLATSPTGAPVTYAGTTMNAPFTRNAAVDFEPNISAAPSFVSGGTTYEFAGWSNGEPRSHVITIPSTDLTLTATYRPFTGYARPKAATPLYVALVPVYTPCTTPNRVHGGGLPGPSCTPPALGSASLTTGTPDSNGAEANMTAGYRATVCEGGACGAGDVLFSFSATDVRCAAGTAPCGPANTASGADYTGELRVTSSLRITDRLNGGSGTTAMATGPDTPFPVTVQCTGTADASIGARCALDTSANAVVPGAVPSGARSLWEMGSLSVFDGGPDGDVDTAAGNALFLTQGLFAP